MPDRATDSDGLRPTVDIVGDRDGAITVKAGKRVTLVANVRTPDAGGKVIKAEWDLEGDGTRTDGKIYTPRTFAPVPRTHRFSKPGAYVRRKCPRGGPGRKAKKAGGSSRRAPMNQTAGP